MAGNSSAQYLESKVLTASQPQLQLMLLEGAVRQCRSAHQAGANAFWGEFDGSLNKAMDIVEELVTSVCRVKSEISQQLEEQYAFIFRELTAARFSMDLPKLESCITLLDFQRETWKLACDKFESQPAARAKVIAPHLLSSGPLAGEGLSLEA